MIQGQSAPGTDRTAPARRGNAGLAMSAALTGISGVKARIDPDYG